MYLAIDIGGTKTLTALFDANGIITYRQKFKTPSSYQDFLKALKITKKEFPDKNIVSGCVGVRGRVDRSSGVLLQDSLLGWHNVGLVADLQNIFSCSFVIENDAKLAGLSEAHLSGSVAGRVLYITISTGIGSAYVVNGEIDSNVADSEIGKWLFEHDGSLQHWEDFASGKTIVEHYGKRAAELDDLKAWEEITKNIAMGLINASAAYTPDIIIIGGGVGSHFAKYEDPLRAHIKNMKPDVVYVPPIQQAKNAEEAVIYGCYEHIKQNRIS